MTDDPSPGLALDGIVTVVDAVTIHRQWTGEYVGDVIARQVEATDLVMLNELDLVDDATRSALRRWLADHTTATVVQRVVGRLDISSAGPRTRERSELVFIEIDG